MTHELKELLETGFIWQQKGIKSVLVTVVALQGSSYRRPGVRMLLGEHNKWIGAVSGGCVEKEVYLQAQSVFKTGEAKLMSYDGRFRLGCEGILHLLLEPLHVTEACYASFQNILTNRKKFTCNSYFKIDIDVQLGIGSVLQLENESFPLTEAISSKELSEFECFPQEFSPIFQLYIFGAEHDAVQLCKMASQIGWQVHIVAPPDEAKSLDYFVGATSLLTPDFNEIETSNLDENTALVLMTHSFNKDIQYLMALKDVHSCYFGLLGPSHRRERIFSKFLEYYPETDVDFFEKIYGPMGINIGAESASEISLSILAEILSVVRNQQPIFLKDKTGHIHG